MSVDLYLACHMGDVAKVQACLAIGVNVNAKQWNGKTPLMGAVRYNRI